ncbi:MAG: aldehyde dehydrogenase family protein [Chloroflexi bacterium]|nr:aldehyde dehydrogenase family protein [Chloroflexota bacterium]
MSQTYPIFVAGAWEDSPTPLQVPNPYDGSVAGTTFLASEAQLERAIAAAQAAFAVTRPLPGYERARILRETAAGLAARKEDLARSIALAAGKPIRDARAEVDRGVFTFEVAAEEARRMGGEVIPLDWLPASAGRFALTRRFPVGPVGAISPFNFPLNLAAHKVAPALAVGCPMVLRPPTDAPITMLMVAQIVEQAGLPKGALSVLPMSRSLGERLATDPRLKIFSFTGSAPVGWALKEKAGPRKKVLLELGGNAGVIVDKDADLERAIPRIVTGSFSYAGQICISVQRCYVHRDILGEFTRRFQEAAQNLKMGDPLDPETQLGPLIDGPALRRVEAWVGEAVAGGARVLAGGHARGLFFEPTILTNVDPRAKVCQLEAFAPLVNLFPFADFAGALAQINDSAYGLQAGVFTGSLEHALMAFRELEVGGVIINDIPTYRIDHMPYGGVKESGFGREGLRYAIEEMTEPRLLVFSSGWS